MDIAEFIKNYGDVGTNVLLIAAVLALWRDNVSRQARYENCLERCIGALTRINDFLDRKD